MEGGIRVPDGWDVGGRYKALGFLLEYSCYTNSGQTAYGTTYTYGSV
jgi:hypothetical protein